MLYEKLMKMAHQCHRNGMRGANAELYRNMDLAVHELQYPQTSHHPVDQLEYIAEVAIGVIRTYVENAIRRAAAEIKNQEDREILQQQLLALPAGHRQRQALDNAIRTTVAILAKNNIVVP